MRRHISTVYFKRKRDESGKPTGVYEIHSMKPMKRVLEQVTEVLEALLYGEDGANAASIAEWIYHDERRMRSAPKGTPFAAMIRGSSEGYLVKILAIDPASDIAHCMVTIKYLSDKEFVYKIVQELNEALGEGLYVTEEFPQIAEATTVA